MECIGFAVLGDFPFFRDAGGNFTTGSIADQAFKGIVNDIRAGIFGSELRINTFWFGAITAAEYAFRLGIEGEQNQGSEKHLFHIHILMGVKGKLPPRQAAR